MKKIKGFSTFNLGNGNGFSVLEVIKGCEYIVDKNIPFQIQKINEKLNHSKETIKKVIEVTFIRLIKPPIFQMFCS